MLKAESMTNENVLYYEQINFRADAEKVLNRSLPHTGLPRPLSPSLIRTVLSEHLRPLFQSTSDPIRRKLARFHKFIQRIAVSSETSGAL
ncbi:MAG: hypothetical protein C4325_03620 [Blastocatellia bacterium]